LTTKKLKIYINTLLFSTIFDINTQASK